jgi:hypothetical protein
MLKDERSQKEKIEEFCPELGLADRDDLLVGSNPELKAIAPTRLRIENVIKSTSVTLGLSSAIS